MRLNLAWLQCDPQGMLGACQVLGRVLSQSSSCSGEIRKTFSEMVLPLQCFVANQRGWIQASGLPSSENPKFPVIFVQCELMEFPYGLRAFESWWCRHCNRRTGETGTGSVLQLGDGRCLPARACQHGLLMPSSLHSCLGVLVQSAPGSVFSLFFFFFFSRIAKRLSSIKFPPCGSAPCPWLFMPRAGLDTISGSCVSSISMGTRVK